MCQLTAAEHALHHEPMLGACTSTGLLHEIAQVPYFPDWQWGVQRFCMPLSTAL